MVTDLVAPGNFQDRIFAKIKESIGDLMTDEDLKRLVEAAMQDAFFKERVTQGDYGRREVKPPFLVELITELTKQRVDAALSEWLKAHQADVLKILLQRLDAGASTLLARAFDERMSLAMIQFGDQLKSTLGLRT